jgi:hypothetical protein
MLVSAVTETTLAKWVKQLGGSGKSIANKHCFVSGALDATVRDIADSRQRPVAYFRVVTRRRIQRLCGSPPFCRGFESRQLHQ